jgi:hypothetical protein
LGSNILLEVEYKAGKEVQIQLTKAVALENNCSSITAAQRASRATKTTRPGSESESELVSTLATAANTVSTATSILVVSPLIRQPNQILLNQVDVQNSSPRLQPRLQPIRQLFTQLQSTLIQQPQGQISPDLPAPEPVKRARKRKALVQDHGEVDMGPRKLRSRK